MPKKYWFIIVFALLVAVGWQSFQLVKAKQQASLDLKGLSREMALTTFNNQYAQVLDKITIREVNTSEATVIYWTENSTSPDGKILLHASAVVNGIVLEFPQARDVTDYLK